MDIIINFNDSQIDKIIAAYLTKVCVENKLENERTIVKTYKEICAGGRYDSGKIEVNEKKEIIFDPLTRQWVTKDV